MTKRYCALIGTSRIGTDAGKVGSELLCERKPLLALYRFPIWTKRQKKEEKIMEFVLRHITASNLPSQQSIWYSFRHTHPNTDASISFLAISYYDFRSLVDCVCRCASVASNEQFIDDNTTPTSALDYWYRALLFILSLLIS